MSDAGRLTADDLSVAFEKIERTDAQAGAVTVGVEAWEELGRMGSDALVPATEEELFRNGFVGSIWGANLHVSCPPGEVMASDEVIERRMV